MLYRIFTFALLISTVSLFAQNHTPWSAQLQVGLGGYSSSGATVENIYNRTGGWSKSLGNLPDGPASVYTAIRLNAQLTNRWSLAPFASYQYSNAEMFKNDEIYVGTTSSNTTPSYFTQPAEHELRAFTAGAYLLYHFREFKKFNSYLGAGLSYAYHSRYYRERLVVDFSEDNTPSNIAETYTKLRGDAMGIPFTAGIDRQLTDNLSLGLALNGQVFQDLKDVQASAAIGVTYHW